MLGKAKHVGQLVNNLRDTITSMREYQIKLNLKKCVFDMPVGKLLDFIMSSRGIKANPTKIRALDRLEVPTELKHVQRLAGCMTLLSRFISRLKEKALPLYGLLKQTNNFKWTEEAAVALEDIKTRLATNPILAALGICEPMILYISATNQVVSATLVVERDLEDHKFQVQKPVYYVSDVLTPCKTRYLHYQKIAYAVFMASRKVWHYFQECSVTVASDVPLSDIINNRGATRCRTKWDIELLPLEITYQPRRAIKSQVLADFEAEYTEAELPREYNTYSHWTMYFDGSKMLAGLGVGVVLTLPTGDNIRYVLQIMYTDSNNAVEYEALLHGFRIAVSMGVKRLKVRGDSNLLPSPR
jgi:hypothetical protein